MQQCIMDTLVDHRKLGLSKPLSDALSNISLKEESIMWAFLGIKLSHPTIYHEIRDFEPLKGLKLSISQKRQEKSLVDSSQQFWEENGKRG